MLPQCFLSAHRRKVYGLGRTGDFHSKKVTQFWISLERYMQKVVRSRVRWGWLQERKQEWCRGTRGCENCSCWYYLSLHGSCLGREISSFVSSPPFLLSLNSEQTISSPNRRFRSLRKHPILSPPFRLPVRVEIYFLVHRHSIEKK